MKKGGLTGAGVGAVVGGVIVGGLALASAPITVPAAILTVVGVAAVGALIGWFSGK